MPIFRRKSEVRPQPIAVQAVPAGGAGAPLEPRVQALGRELLERARGHKTGMLSAKFYSDALMEWSMKDPAFKVQMFRFVDAFPVLRDPEQIYEHLTDYMEQPGVQPPKVISAALATGRLAKPLAAKTIKSQIEGMAPKFIAGGSRAFSHQPLDVGRDDDGLGAANVADTVHVTPIEELHHRLGVCLSRVRISDRCRKELDEAACRVLAGGGNRCWY
ncbi:hypothetical protein J4558_13215 [Leptolyngbya sp. 15MV]|nr:hypothetical protein J4558_13215 [Leptolyngbya sp. 15MV]